MKQLEEMEFEFDEVDFSEFGEKLREAGDKAVESAKASAAAAAEKKDKPVEAAKPIVAAMPKPAATPKPKLAAATMVTGTLTAPKSKVTAPVGEVETKKPGLRKRIRNLLPGGKK